MRAPPARVGGQGDETLSRADPGEIISRRPLGPKGNAGRRSAALEKKGEGAETRENNRAMALKPFRAKIRGASRVTVWGKSVRRKREARQRGPGRGLTECMNCGVHEMNINLHPGWADALQVLEARRLKAGMTKRSHWRGGVRRFGHARRVAFVPPWTTELDRHSANRQPPSTHVLEIKLGNCTNCSPSAGHDGLVWFHPTLLLFPIGRFQASGTSKVKGLVRVYPTPNKRHSSTLPLPSPEPPLFVSI